MLKFVSMLCLSACFVLALPGCGIQHTSSPEYKAQEKIRQDFIQRAKSFVPADQLPKIDPNYFTYTGFRDTYRFPLVYPYEFTMIDLLKEGSIGIHESVKDSPRYDSVGATHCEFNANVFVGATEDTWVMFEFKTGKSISFKTKAELMAEAAKHGLAQDTVLITVEEQFRNFANEGW